MEIQAPCVVSMTPLWQLSDHLVRKKGLVPGMALSDTNQPREGGHIEYALGIVDVGITTTFLWHLAEIDLLLFKSFLSCFGLLLSWYLTSARPFLLGLCRVSFFSFKSGVYQSKSNSRELITILLLGFCVA